MNPELPILLHTPIYSHIPYMRLYTPKHPGRKPRILHLTKVGDLLHCVKQGHLLVLMGLGFRI